MEPAGVFSVLSKCFSVIDDDEWEAVRAEGAWFDFLESVRRLLAEPEALADSEAQADARVGARPQGSPTRIAPPLSDYLAACELEAVLTPPAAHEKRAFAAAHFTGGLAQTALPVESLYRDERGWLRKACRQRDAGGESGSYMGPTARYMQAQCDALGLSVPQEFGAWPDHLSLELDMVAVLLRSGMAKAACGFAAERFAWLSVYRMRLLELGDEALFYVALIDLIVGIVSELPEASSGLWSYGSIDASEQEGRRQCQRML